VTTVAPSRDVRDRFALALTERIGPDRFRRYFGSRESIEYDGGRLRVVAGSAFQAEMLSRRFGEAVRDAAASEGERGRVEFTVRESARAAETPPPAEQAEPPEPGPAPEHAAPPRARPPRHAATLRRSLDDFVIGESNRLAHGAALRLAEEGPGSPLSPLVFHGPCGAGKTHLLQGLARRVQELRPGARVRYTTGESFTNGFIRAVRENRTASFHAEHRRLDLLCIDDVHFLANKNATQTELLHTLNALADGGARIALVSDAHPSLIRSFSRELVSRFMAGMVVSLDPPDMALRMALTVEFGARRGVVLDREGAELIASHARASVRELEGALVRVEAVARLSEAAGSGPVPLAVIRQALRLGAPVGPARRVRAEAIIRSACERLGVEVSDVMGRSRHRRVVAARSIAALLARRLTTLSYPELAQKLGRPNHSSVVTACQRLEKQMAAGAGIRLSPGEPETPFSALVREIETDLTRGPPG